MINFFIFILIIAIIYVYLQNIETFGLKFETPKEIPNKSTNTPSKTCLNTFTEKKISTISSKYFRYDQ